MALGAQLLEARRRMKLTASEVAAATRMKVQIVEAIEEEDFTKIAAPIYGKGFIRLYAEHVGLNPLPLVDEYMVRFVESKTPSLISEDQPQGKPAPEPVEPPAEATQAAEPEAEDEDPSIEEDDAGTLEQDDDLDLFSRLDRPPRRAEQNKQKPSPPNVRERSLGDAWQAVAAPCRDLWAKTSKSVRSKLPRPKPVPAPAETGAAAEPERKRPLHIASISIGVIIILIFIVSVLSRCLPNPPSNAAGDPDPQTLQVAIEPSAPYFD